MVVVNSFLAVLLPIPAVSLARSLYPSAKSWEGAIVALVLFFPVSFLFLTLPMRMSISMILAFSVLALIVRSFVEYELWPTALAFPMIGILTLIRPELGLIITVASVGAVVVHIADYVIERDITIPMLSVFAVPVGALGFAGFTRFFSLKTLEEERDWRAQGGAAYLQDMSYESWTDVLLSAPLRGIYFQFAPFPWQVESTFHLLGLSSLPILLVLSALALYSFVRKETDVTVAMLLLTVYFGGIVGYGLVNSNFGTNVRHRIIFNFLLVIFAGPAFYDSKQLLARKYESWRE
ncbi:hypothetical protein [Halomarina ordinaria]|uniref:Glycosyltransferase RgtA/B/C/D-like domain-containing protein n=1 Tax=Halomarina ordinaria TaxID=3033939 RepID=A0ABD5U8J7_9EURY|nr:hypothetical protein [Halomarina sp. PSRA2]